MAIGIVTTNAHKNNWEASAEVHLMSAVEKGPRLLYERTPASDKVEKTVCKHLAVPKEAMIVPKRFDQSFSNFDQSFRVVFSFPNNLALHDLVFRCQRDTELYRFVLAREIAGDKLCICVFAKGEVIQKTSNYNPTNPT